MFSFHPFCFLPKHSPIVLGLVQGPLKRPKNLSCCLQPSSPTYTIDTSPYKYNGYEVVAVCRKHSPISQNRKILLFLRTFLKLLDIRDLDPLDFSLYCNRFPKFTMLVCSSRNFFHFLIYFQIAITHGNLQILIPNLDIFLHLF